MSQRRALDLIQALRSKIMRCDQTGENPIRFIDADLQRVSAELVDDSAAAAGSRAIALTNAIQNAADVDFTPNFNAVARLIAMALGERKAQHQGSTEDQLRELMQVANQLGLQDAADAISSLLMVHPTWLQEQ